MSMDYLPLKIEEKFRRRFLKSTLKLGEEISFTGYSVKLPTAPYLRELLWSALGNTLGEFQILGITPFPVSGAPVLPVVYPSWLKTRAPVVEITGRVFDFSQFSTESGRFILAENVRGVPVEKYLSLEKAGVDGKKAESIMKDAFSETTAQVMLGYFLSTSTYISRTGGNAITLVETSSRYYAQSFSEILGITQLISPALRHSEVKLRLIYDDELELSLKPRMKIRYSKMSTGRASKYYSSRKSKLWEHSALTVAPIKLESMLTLADVPFIPTKEEVQVIDPTLLREYSMDIGIFAMQSHILRPEIDVEKTLSFKAHLIEMLERELPELLEAMQMGLIVDIGDINGVGEHMSRLLDSTFRAHGTWAEAQATNLYMEMYRRIWDIHGASIRKKLAFVKKGETEKRIINRVLWELNVLKPEGWDYRYFETKMKERGVENIYRKFEELRKEGLVIEKRNDRYLAVAGVE